VSSPSDPAREGGDDAAAAIALLRSPGPRDPRVTWGLGVLGFAALLAIVVLVRGLTGNTLPATGPLSPFINAIPFYAQGTPTPSPTAISVAPATSAGATTPGTVVPPSIVAPTTSPTGLTLPPPPPTATPNPTLLSQSINWTSGPPSAATFRGTYHPTATGGGSNNPVVFGSLTALVCTSVSGTIDFVGVGACEIDATQAGNSRYNPAPTRTMSFMIGKAPQAVAFTSSPSSPAYGGSYTVTASALAGAVTFSADTSSAACSVTSSGAVQFTATGACIIDANQGGNSDYNAAQQIQQQFDVVQASQLISFTSQAPSCPCTPGQQYTVMAAGGGSGNPVTFNIDPSSTALICSISGSTVTISGGLPGTCIIDAFQQGNANFSAAPEEQQTINVS
jgi:hypothetical protein